MFQTNLFTLITAVSLLLKGYQVSLYTLKLMYHDYVNIDCSKALTSFSGGAGGSVFGGLYKFNARTGHDISASH